MYQWLVYNTTSGALGTHEQTLSPMVDVNGTQEFDPNLIPSGCAVIGPYDGSNPMDANTQSAYNNPSEYLYQNGAFVSNPNYASAQLTSAKTARLTYLSGAFAQSIGAGFTSSADGTSRTYAIDPVAMGKWTGTLANINSGMLTATIQVKDIAGNKVTLTPAQFKQFAMDGFTYFNNQEQNYWTKEDAVDSATTIADVNAVVY